MEKQKVLFKGSNLKKVYNGRAVVNDIGVEIEQGEIVGLLGPNGAGKTTTFYMMVGLVKADRGNIHLGSDELTQEPLYARATRGIGYLPQDASVFRDLTVKENILAVLETKKSSTSKKKTLEEKVFRIIQRPSYNI